VKTFHLKYNTSIINTSKEINTNKQGSYFNPTRKMDMGSEKLRWSYPTFQNCSQEIEK
jgi:hypothetical protein